MEEDAKLFRKPNFGNVPKVVIDGACWKAHLEMLVHSMA